MLIIAKTDSYDCKDKEQITVHRKIYLLNTNKKNLKKDMLILVKILQIQKTQLEALNAAFAKCLQACKRPNG